MKQIKVIRAFSLIVTVLICLTSWRGLFSPGVYTKETELWTAQAMGQDLINLYIIPFYLLSALLINRKENYFALIWTGISSYFVYTFLIYCFDIQFNRMFLLYVSILGLTCYSLFIFYYANGERFYTPKKPSFLHQLTGGYFIFTAILFSGTWLSVIIPATVFNTVPEDLEMLPTNPVHVLDLAIVLPGIFIAGLLLIRDRKLGHFLAPVVLTFSALMQLTIVLLMLFLEEHGKHTPSGVIWFVFVLALISSVLLLLNLKHQQVHHEKTSFRH